MNKLSSVKDVMVKCNQFMQGFVKIIPSQNVEIILSFIGIVIFSGLQFFWKRYDVHNNVVYIMTKF